MSADNPTLAELGIASAPASVLASAGIETRSAIEAFGLARLTDINGIGAGYADEIRKKVAASYEVTEPPAETAEAAPAPAPEPPAPIDKDRLERATLTIAAGLLGAIGPDPNLAPMAKHLAEDVLREIDR